METKMSERETAMKIANKILDTPYIDPDGDMCILSRQFLRAAERESAELGDGEPSPAPDSKIRQALMTHWLSQIECNHYEKSDSAICACGWKSERGFNVGKAVELWIDHVFLESGAAQEVSPTCPLCKKSNHFIRQPGTCSHPFHDEPFRKMLEEVSPPTNMNIGLHKSATEDCGNCGTHVNDWPPAHMRPARAEKAEGDTRELKAALRWIPVEEREPPKDGSEVLLRVKFRAGIAYGTLVGHWMRGGHCIEDHPPIESGWYFWNGTMFDRVAEPTHWMALPGDEGL